MGQKLAQTVLALPETVTLEQKWRNLVSLISTQFLPEILLSRSQLNLKVLNTSPRPTHPRSATFNFCIDSIVLSCLSSARQLCRRYRLRYHDDLHVFTTEEPAYRYWVKSANLSAVYCFLPAVLVKQSPLHERVGSLLLNRRKHPCLWPEN